MHQYRYKVEYKVVGYRVINGCVLFWRLSHAAQLMLIVQSLPKEVSSFLNTLQWLQYAYSIRSSTIPNNIIFLQHKSYPSARKIIHRHNFLFFSFYCMKHLLVMLFYLFYASIVPYASHFSSWHCTTLFRFLQFCHFSSYLNVQTIYIYPQ